MNDDEVAELLDSDAPLVLIEAPAGCGKTYQGANYAARAAGKLRAGRVLILTHTHAACGVFANATKQASRKAEIRTIDSIIVQIAAAYHQSLGLPADPYVWARQTGSGGFQAIASKVSRLLKRHPMICGALADRYPVVIADEHQDSSVDQEAVFLALRQAGARLRVFGDPVQRIYGGAGQVAATADRERWGSLKADSEFAELETPHRWNAGSPELGQWVLEARRALRDGGQVDLTGRLPTGLVIHFAENTAQTRSGFQVSFAERRPLDQTINSGDPVLILTGQNETADALAAFWNRRIPIWEGHTRDALSELVKTASEQAGNAPALSQAITVFMGSVAVGFSASSHGDRLQREVADGCNGRARGKPALIQELGRHIVDEPSHIGVARCLGRLLELLEQGVAGFDGIKIDHRREFRDAIRLGDFSDPDEGLTEIHRRRTFARPMPPERAISTIHKAKGLECDNAMIVPCDARAFSSTDYARCKLYVALSRAKRSLTLVLSRGNPSPLFCLK